MVLQKDRDGGPSGQDQVNDKENKEEDQMEAAYLSLK
jgi:hypothetical protein